MLRNGRFMAVAVAVGLLTVACGGHGGHDAPSGQAASAPAATGGTRIEPYQPRFGRDRPLVAVISASDGAELTDFAVPYGVLATSGVADVIALSTASGPVEMFPALTLEMDATLAEFDEEHPDGADYVIVPAVHDAEDAALVDWIQDQHGKGATIVGVCDGVLLLANSGVLVGRRATAHWYSMGGLEKDHPETEWVKDLRYVADDNVVTTTGVSASVPVSLALVDAIAGRDTADAVAASFGVEDWSAAHRSDAYGVGVGDVLTVIKNHLTFWRQETLGIDLASGLDEISLALMADTWARTGRASVVSIADRGGPIRTRGGLTILPDRVRGDADGPARMLETSPRAEAGLALDRALAGVAESYGMRTAAFVALQMEYPWTPAQ